MTAARGGVVAVVLAAGVMALTAAPAAATSPPSPTADVAPTLLGAGTGGLGVAGTGGLLGAGTGGLGAPGTAGLLGAGTGGLLGAGAGSLVGVGTSLGLAVISSAVVSSAAVVLHETAAALGTTTAPQLQSTWFSSTYWRMAAIATMLTLPFLFAATVQAVLQSDVTVLARAALGYLPLAMLAIAIAAPVTSLLLAASDELCGLISAAAANESAHVLAYTSVLVAGLSALGQSPFMAFLIGLFVIGAAFALWIELLLRDAAVYVVVLMLPLAFAALAWPARRIWAVRAVEILVALVLSKFAIVAVLSLGGAAIAASVGHANVSGLMAGTVLILLAAVSPWALLRFVPLAEVAAGTAGALRGELRAAIPSTERPRGYAQRAAESVIRRTAEMNRDAALPTAEGANPPPPPPDLRGSEPPGSRDARDPRDPSDSAPAEAGEGAGHDTPPRREPRWSERQVLELGPDFAGTPVWPHPDAE